MSKILVVGDSFMSCDKNYPGQHWSEMLTEHEVVNLSEPGASNVCIAGQLIQGLELNPDYIFIGFTSLGRIEYDIEQHQRVQYKKSPTFLWATNLQKNFLNDSQLKYYQDTVKYQSIDAWQLRESLVVGQCLQIIKDSKIPFAWSPQAYELGHASRMSSDNRTQLRYQHITRKYDILSNLDLAPFKIDYNLAKIWATEYVVKGANLMDHANFHVDQGDHQQLFAQLVKSKFNLD
jgi:hypothetical protein